MGSLMTACFLVVSFFAFHRDAIFSSLQLIGAISSFRRCHVQKTKNLKNKKNHTEWEVS